MGFLFEHLCANLGIDLHPFALSIRLSLCKQDGKGQLDMQINLYTATIRQAELLREAEQQRLVRSVMNQRRPVLHFKLPFRLKWSYAPKAAAPHPRECPTPC